MKIENKIKQDLEAQSKELDALMAESNTLSGYLKLGFSSQMSWLMKIGYALAILISAVLIYCGYRFFTALPDEQIFWGVCFIISVQVQVTTKLWIYMQTNRIYLSKELRLLASHKQL